MEWNSILKSPLLYGLTENEVEKLMEPVPFTIKKFKAGSVIALSGETVSSFRIVISGVVKGEMVDYSGRVIKIEDIPAPQAVAPAFIFGRMNRFPVNVVAVTATQMLVIERPAFLGLLMSDNRILVNYLDMISNRSQFLSDKIRFLSFKTIKSKLAQYILQAAGESRQTIVLELTQNELADYFGVARPSVGRALGEMEEDDLVEVKAKSIRIIDRKRLIDLTSN